MSRLIKDLNKVEYALYKDEFDKLWLDIPSFRRSGFSKDLAFEIWLNQQDKIEKLRKEVVYLKFGIEGFKAQEFIFSEKQKLKWFYIGCLVAASLILLGVWVGL